MKAVLLEIIRKELKTRLDRMADAARDARAAATDPDSKAEGKYDTRCLEASYLAAGQARQAGELAEALRVFGTLTLPDYSMEDAIDSGALVEVETGGETSLLLLVPAAGGMVIEEDGREITLLTPASALYRKLLGARAGDFLNDGGMRVTEVS